MDGFYKLIDKSIEGNKTQMISFDSVNFIASYLLNQTDTFFIKPAVKYRKDTIYIIKEMLVVNNQDTIKLDDYYSFNFMFFNDSLKYKPFKIEGFYFEQINE